MTHDFLLEIGSEEIPAGVMPKLLHQVERLALEYVKEHRLSYERIEVLGTPRRIALLMKGVADEAEDLAERHKGPSVKIAFDADGNPTKAAMGFARGKGIDASNLVVEGEYVYAETLVKGRQAKDILTALVPHIMDNLTFPKSMHWGDYEARFIRPVRWFVILFDEEVIPFTYASATSSNITRGHRFLGEKTIFIQSPSTYVDTLRTHFVLVDPAERKQRIVEGLESVAKKESASVLWDEALLEEVVYLVEYPTALSGSFDEVYLSLPKETVITPMKDHQRYFPMVDIEGHLLSRFLTVRNGDEKHIDTVTAGNERVLRARLEDARFFFNEDRKKTLEERIPSLQKVVFQEGLGTMLDKKERLVALTRWMAEKIVISSTEIVDVARAAMLAKTDLVTGMVVEFTELQGIMGREYALLDGEKESVATAIFEQYLPRFAGDILPNTEIGAMLSIADKMDNIVATFSRGLIPTGSQDPYALRRQTIGILNILESRTWELSIRELAVETAKLLGVIAQDMDALIEQIEVFFTLRLKNMYLERGWEHALVELLLSRKESTVLSNLALAQALLEHPVYKNVAVAQAFTRAYNLVKEVTYTAVDTSLFKEEVEKALYEKALELKKQAKLAIENKDYTVVVSLPEVLAPIIDDFFSSVMVMDKDENIKENRLQLLALTYSVFSEIGNISVLK